MTIHRTNHLRVLIVGLALVAVAVVAAVPADASAPPAFAETSSGTWQTRPWGDVLVKGPGEHTVRNGQPKDVTVAAVISPFDRTMPAAGECEGAHGWISIDADRLRTAWLIGIGEVCGVHPQPGTSIVTHVYTGDFEVWEGHQPFLGARGFMEIRLAENGTAHTFATTH